MVNGTAVLEPLTRADAEVMFEEPDITHDVCLCTPDIALCGANVNGMFWANGDDDERDCPMCVAVADVMGACVRCGEVW